MQSTSKIATVFGGSGFVGRYIVRRLAKDGWRVRVAVRRPNEAMFVRTYGAVGQVEPILANIRDETSTRAAIAGSDAVINCVGILVESRRQKFDEIQGESAGRIARLAAEAGVAHLVHMSAISAEADSQSAYARSKAAGEAAVLAAYPDAVILRPSVVFGPEDDFFNRFARMARFTIVLPLVGAETMFQPVYVDDVAKAAVKAAEGQARAGVYELGGPVARSFRNLMRGMLRVVRRRRLLVNIPFWMARINAWFLDIGSKMTVGLFPNKILTRDQVKLLAHDNVVSDDALKLSDLGIEPTPMESILESYLYCHRPSGQYTAIKESAANLRES
ncbi:MAG: complex I NDUFA9 subunit family protein [Alphaproteobacteria bacterium]|nr:complex I NDUFA9 subunit family protein [Alphaproteobacteria bacterium]